VHENNNPEGVSLPARPNICSSVFVISTIPAIILVRCGLLLPSLQTGDEVCEKSGWCQTCTRIPPHVSSNLLRECLNLRREQEKERRSIIESFEEYFSKIDDEANV